MEKKKIILFVLILSCFVFHANAGAEERPSAELIAQGKALFNHKEGLKVKFACILCHQQEKAIKKSSLEKIGDKLPVIINKHITEKAKGPAISADSQEMKALIAYIRYEHSK